jgi:hypothetical protein
MNPVGEASADGVPAVEEAWVSETARSLGVLKRPRGLDDTY